MWLLISKNLLSPGEIFFFFFVALKNVDWSQKEWSSNPSLQTGWLQENHLLTPSLLNMVFGFADW